MVYTTTRPEMVFITPPERRLRENLGRARDRANNWAEAFKEAAQAMLTQMDELRVQAEQYKTARSEAQREREELRQTARELADLLSSAFGSAGGNTAPSSSTPEVAVQQDPELT
ncbi:hypothetical protein QAD02_017755 [Eretmocerus hayati]|uniref:Uncharacterized protein n=1 Tax=Eretmocerus hayati TaxID=131215 RepID=A0ACC2PFW0_9HYME|nr:hypothetical protein QAD02_017755 [Eretmocerus hayati]